MIHSGTDHVPASQSIVFGNAYYIKLGRGGEWEENCINDDKLRLGWQRNSLESIQAEDWVTVRHNLQDQSPGVVTRDVNALTNIARSTSDDLWVTFYGSKMWWCRLADEPMQEDAISKFRRTLGPWNDKDVHGSLLLISRIPGSLSRVQSYRGTVCSIQDHDLLRRVLNDQVSPVANQLAETHSALIKAVANAIRVLHWKDFETLVDLVFRDAGWRRISVLGETMKFADLELEEPVTGDRYQVQIKSEASLRDFENYERAFQGKSFRRLYFVVHSPHRNLSEHQPKSNAVELILSDRLAAMVVDAGLVNWLQAKVR